MRVFFAVAFACALVRCTPQQFNQSQVKSSEDIVSIEKDESGTYTVLCKHGTIEYKVAMSQIQSSQVCYPPQQDDTQVNPMAFNAFDIWRNGRGGEILDYPEGYEVDEGPTTADGVFYVETNSFWIRLPGEGNGERFVGVPTKDATVVNNVLEYPTQNGKQLKLKFTEVFAPPLADHSDAVQYCKDIGARLPTARELFDFCAAGVTEPNYGPDYKPGNYPPTARCYNIRLASASVFSRNRDRAWLIEDEYGALNISNRAFNTAVRCVTRP